MSAMWPTIQVIYELGCAWFGVFRLEPSQSKLLWRKLDSNSEYIDPYELLPSLKSSAKGHIY